jgi:hypothetical protein
MRKDIKHSFKTNPMLMDETKKIRLKKLGVIIFGSVRFLSKKVTKPKFFYFKKTKTGSNRQVSVRFGFFRAKTGLARFFRFGLVFFPAFFFSVRFDFLCFLLIKPKPNRPVFSKF